MDSLEDFGRLREISEKIRTARQNRAEFIVKLKRTVADLRNGFIAENRAIHTAWFGPTAAEKAEVRAKAAAEAREKAAEEVRAKAAAKAREKAAEEVRAKAAAKAREKAVEEVREKAAAKAREKAAEEVREKAAEEVRAKAAAEAGTKT